MKHPLFDKDEFPTNKTLKEIKNWKLLTKKDFDEFIAFITECINPHYGRITVITNYKKLKDFNVKPFTALEIATGGWSINEAVVQHINQNIFVLSMMLMAEIRGGLFVYNYNPTLFKNENSY